MFYLWFVERLGKTMKIKTDLFGIRKVADVPSSTKKKVEDSGASTDSQSVDSFDVQMSQESLLIRAFREAAKGQEPKSMDLIEQAKRDMEKGLLGSDEDYEQVINALLQEL